MIRLVEVFAFSILQRTADAVGLYKLEKTYEDVMQSDSSLAIAMIDVAVRLEHMPSFPENEVVAVHERTVRLAFARGLLTRFVHRHFYLYETGLRLKQRMCSRLGIQIDGEAKALGVGR